jgi:hypothetical protein
MGKQYDLRLKWLRVSARTDPLLNANSFFIPPSPSPAPPAGWRGNKKKELLADAKLCFWLMAQVRQHVKFSTNLFVKERKILELDLEGGGQAALATSIRVGKEL